LSDSHSTECGVFVAPNRRSQQAIIRSQTISAETPAVVADHAMISRSQASMANSIRTTAPSRQRNSRWSEHQRTFERNATTMPSWVRPGRRAVCGARVSPFARMMRSTRLALTLASPRECSARFTSAVTRR